MESLKKKLAEYFINEASVIVLEVDISGKILWSNKFASSLIKKDLEETNIRDFFSDFDSTWVLTELLKGETQKLLLNVNTYTGIPDTFYFSCYKQGETLLIIGELNNIEVMELKKNMISINNELYNLTRDLQKKNAELELSNRLKNQFVGMAAHDLRNPIGSIKMFSEFLLSDRPNQLPPDKIRHIVGTINKSSSFMLQLLDELLDLTKIESGRIEIKLKKTDPTKFLNDIIEINSLIASKKQIKITTEFSENLPLINIDRAKIEQVINNLISNAIKYSHQGTVIEVKISITYEDVVFCVKDQGVGIKKENLDLIFKPFSKIGRGGTAGEKSTGLGLSIVRRIINGHKGRIWVESSEGKGSSFYFSLPLNGQNHIAT